MSRSRTLGGAALVAVAIVAIAAGLSKKGVLPDARPNVVVVLTDDQSIDSLPRDPPAMPYLQGRIEDPSDHWVGFTNAFLSTPMCCPTRATLLTGRYAEHTGVLDNATGGRLDESSTVATWLHDAGYRTGFFGKYLNRYPFGRGNYVPPGWDRWLAKAQGGPGSVYYDYTLVRDGFAVPFGSGPEEYLTDVLVREAAEFVRETPPGEPFLLWFAPTGPHAPRTPAPRHEGAFAGSERDSAPAPDVSGAPAWVRSLPALSGGKRTSLEKDRVRQYEALLAVDEAVASIVSALRARGDLERTVIFFLTDNGLSFGEHRWVGKACPYAECARTPLAIRFPGAHARDVVVPVSSVDIAPTIAEVADMGAAPAADGSSLVPLLSGHHFGRRGPVYLSWAGGNGVPVWRGVRTASFSYVELPSTGERELYDIAGVAGPADPAELSNRAGTEAYAGIEARLAAALEQLRPG